MNTRYRATTRLPAGWSALHASCPPAHPPRTTLAASIAILFLGAVPQSASAVVPVGRCGDMVGKGGYTLRQAINLAPDGDTVDLSTLPVTCSTITLTGGEIAIAANSLTIQAPVDRAITVDAAHGGRVFEHTGGGLLTVVGLSLVNGNGYGNVASGADSLGGCVRSAGSVLLQYTSLSGCSAATGGGVHTGGALSLIHATISGCTAAYKPGFKTIGGAAFSNGTLLASYSTIGDNYSQIYTGGVYAKGATTINRTSISQNTANFSTGLRAIGPIYQPYLRCTAIAAQGTVTLTGSTVEGNLAAHPAGQAGARKAALCNFGLLTVKGSTLVANSGYAIETTSSASLTNATLSANGGGVFFAESNLTLFNSTLASNGVGVYGHGTCSLKAISTIAANNGGAIPDFNLPVSCTLDAASSNNITGISPAVAGLTPLAFHGGPTKTHALLPTSAAVDAGLNPGTEDYDQRGIGFTRFAGPAPDIGAYERQINDDELFYGGFD